MCQIHTIKSPSDIIRLSKIKQSQGDLKMDTQEFKYTDDMQEQDVDIKITALLRVLEEQVPNIWQRYRDKLDEEYLHRKISPPEHCLGYYLKP